MSHSPAQLAATRRYNKKTYDVVSFRMRKDVPLNAEYMRRYIEKRGESLTSFILRAISDAIERDKAREKGLTV